MPGDTRELIADGLWHRNAGLVQLLGLCPLLAVSNSVVNALGLGLATVFVLTLTNLLVSLTRGWLPHEVRIPAFVLLIAGAVTCVELLMNAWFHELYRSLGIFLPLIVTNCVILARAETLASRSSPVRATIDGLAMGGGFALALLALGAAREIVGHGSLFAGAGVMIGEWAAFLETQLFPSDKGFLLAVLPPGAFIALGILVALRNGIDSSLRARRAAAAGRTDEWSPEAGEAA
ncbi:MAG TPA: electron transport complex subunit E [Steroidobacteraceae bacterium]|nr:electron transport complex subunit E [Steroidobacteraceae bacterium]